MLIVTYPDGRICRYVYDVTLHRLFTMLARTQGFTVTVA